MRSTDVIRNFLENNTDVSLLLSSQPYDPVDVEKLSNSLYELGYYSNRIIYDLPRKLTNQLRDLNQVSVPKTDFETTSTSSGVATKLFKLEFYIICVSLLYLISKDVISKSQL